jgi:uncharacterized surface protein with fasciclin (FAS1) repeats
MKFAPSLHPRHLLLGSRSRGPAPNLWLGLFATHATEDAPIQFGLVTFAALLALAAPALAQECTKMVGGAPMFPSKSIVENAVNSKDHTTLVAAVKAAGLVDTLAGSGPFTVFAPTNAAFARLPAGTVETLVQPQSKATLTSVLTYHVVPGRYTAKDLMTAVKRGGGEATLKTAQGERSQCNRGAAARASSSRI